MCSTHVLKLELDVQQVGSFARAFFLVHSECLESSYVASRPFRVNAVSLSLHVSSPDHKYANVSLVNLSLCEGNMSITELTQTKRARQKYIIFAITVTQIKGKGLLYLSRPYSTKSSKLP
jgi:3-dehydroquinate synthase class II